MSRAKGGAKYREKNLVSTSRGGKSFGKVEKQKEEDGRGWLNEHEEVLGRLRIGRGEV